MPLEDNLRRAYRFSTTDDEGPDNADGTLSGATLAAGRLVCASAADKMTFSSISIASDFTVCWRGKQDSSDTNGVLAGEGGGNNFLFFNGGSFFRALVGGATADFSGVTTFTSDKDYALVYDDTANTLKLYADGSLIETKTSFTTFGSFILNRVGSGFTGDAVSLKGSLDYFYVWDRALPLADVQSVDSDPDSMFVVSDSISVTDFSAGRVHQRAAGTTAKTVTFTGSYTGTAPTTVEVKVVNQSGGATVVDWTSIGSLSVGGGVWSGTLSVPQGGWYNFIARGKDGGGSILATASQSSNKWGVGILVAMLGQSNMANMRETSSTPPSPSDLTRQYTTGGGWAVVAGNGQIRFANLLQTAVSLPIGLVNFAVGGTGLHVDGGSGYWIDTAGGSPYALFLTGATAVGGDYEVVIWHQGETDALFATSKANYKADLDTFYARLRTATGRSTTTLKFGCALLGNVSDGSTTDANAEAIRQGQLEWIAATTGAFHAGSSVDMVRTDSYHWTAPYYERMGRRYAQAILKQLGSVSFGADGPRVSSASRTLGSADIRVNVSHNGGSSLTELDGTTDGGSVTGFQVSDDDFSTTLTISSTAFSGNRVVLTLSAAPADEDTIKVRYQYGVNPSITNPVYDNTAPQSDTVGLPLQPTNGSVTVGVGSGRTGMDNRRMRPY